MATTTTSPTDGTDIRNSNLDEAFAALQKYDRGSPRASLIPIDDAMTSPYASGIRLGLEQRLLAVLRSAASNSAKEYICGKLAQTGTAAAVSSMAELLSNPNLAHAALNALASIPGPEAAIALRRSLSVLEGIPLLGAIQAVGHRQDVKSVGLLAGLLKCPDPALAGAAAHALGHIGVPSAARALTRFLSAASPGVQNTVADACLICARKLLAEGHPRTVRALCSPLTTRQWPPHFQKAAQLCLAAI
jgi:hypothetical protein